MVRMSNMSPWEIGAAFYDQRDLYTRNARVDRGGYGEGPNVHPPEGSFAYVREPEPSAPPEPAVGGAPSTTTEELVDLYEREAWPWQNYGVGRDLHAEEAERRAKARRSPWQRVKRLLRGRA